MIRLIATDLDGTLLGRDKRVSERNARALAACQERGIRIALCSGRSFRVIAAMAREAGLSNSLIVSSNGARADASADGPLVYGWFIEPETARKAAARLIEAGVFVECYTDDVIYMANRVPLKNHRHRPGIGPDGATLFRDGAEAMLAEGCGCARKLIVFSDDSAQLALARRVLSGLDLALSASGEDNVEIMNPKAGKGAVLEWYMTCAGFQKDEVMAFGDQTNDLDMFSRAGWPVAMENAAADVRKAARLIAPNHDESGVAQILEKYVLEGGNRL